LNRGECDEGHVVALGNSHGAAKGHYEPCQGKGGGGGKGGKIRELQGEGNVGGRDGRGGRGRVRGGALSLGYGGGC